MALAIGTRLGPYEILAPLGAGGMGEVYRARDTKLGREVAVKILPEARAQDRERLKRFEREAQLLASLNHPNIAAIYGLEKLNGRLCIVLELVPGKTLADRIDSGPLHVEEALTICRQIAAALEAAHGKGIIHRDLKPANVNVTPEGKVKVLDFGLAKVFVDESLTNLSGSPTASAIHSTQDAIVGTAAYMSPEQARGMPVDKRTDIWSFGCVLFEALSGKTAFEGATVSDTIAAILNRDPDWQVLPIAVSSKVLDLLHRCLRKDVTRRLRDVGDAGIEIDDALEPSKPIPVSGAGLAGPRALRRHWAIILPLMTLAAVGIGAILGLLLRSKPTTSPIARVAVTLPAKDQLALGPTPVLALSADGSHLAYVADQAGTTQLYLRSIGRFDAIPIPGTQGAESPFFSPNGQSVGFFAEGKLKKISLDGGAPLTLCDAPDNRAASWGPDDTIIFSPSPASGLFRVSAGGGPVQPVTNLDHSKREFSHRWPEILPGGKAVLFTIWTGASFDDARIGLLSLETGEQRVVIEGGTYARYVPSGYLVYARAGSLLAVPFDLKRLVVTGSAVSILNGVSMYPGTGTAEFSSSGNGSLAYVPGRPRVGERTLIWVDRKGTVQPLPAPPRAYTSPRLSPEGQRIAVGIQDSNSGVWLYEFGRGTLTRLIESGGNTFPIWTPDGKHLTFVSPLSGSLNLRWMPADGSAATERLTTSENAQVPGSWSPDGEVLAFSEENPTTGWDIRVLRLKGDRKDQSFLQTMSNEGGAVFSPDGRFLAYQSDESGRQEIYVRPFTRPGGKSQISTEGGTEPVWAHDGSELFYRNGDKMMAAAVKIEPTFAPAKPKLLFEGHYETGATYFANYDVALDGQRFLMIRANEQGSLPTQINVVLNWFEELKQKVPTGKK